ncbi:MAG: pyrroline-5-carboxylate reductase dimerization domain-containing protein, partial [Moraxellaceae bacterium]|nr:pyrroline-5-carboxylate reductase dimerization domain-containing protein [Moraxellaceae bacterium]
AGVKLGLDEQDARALTLQTALGAAQMAITSDVGPAELRKRVTSPGGTTERALRVFNESDLIHIFETALKACANRGTELALELGAAD